MQDEQNAIPTDVVLIGAGIMSATLGLMLKELQPGISIQVFERLDRIAAESSDAWNNAGTGHSAFCELNYTPEKEDGSIDCSKAISILEAFEKSRQFWAWLVEEEIVAPGFIQSIPHISFVWGEENVAFLRKRYEALTAYYAFQSMQYSEDPLQLAEWMPIVMEGRNRDAALAATRMEAGTDVDFGLLTRRLLEHLDKRKHVDIHLGHEVRDIDRSPDGTWRIEVKDQAAGTKKHVYAKFVFIGAGGGSLSLLEKSGIPEGRGFGGFPVSGQWLRCTNNAVINRHHAKVYGKASVGAPPMSVPHLDTRMIDGERALLFGPYAGFSTKFLKNGSFMDLARSIKFSNIMPMISAGLDNIPLTKYLIHEIRQTPEDKLRALQQYMPAAKMRDWELEIAGQRVQVIKKDEDEGGVLEFGTEVVTAADGSLAALLGASPGASTSVAIMIGLIERCFPREVHSLEWQAKLKEMVPGYGSSLVNDPVRCRRMRDWTNEVLGLVDDTVPEIKSE